MQPDTTTDTPIIFFPALGCDRRLGRCHDDLHRPVRWARWVPVDDMDDFAHYAQKVADTVDIPEKCYFAGASLGGLVALQLARKLKPQGVILIGSMRSSADVTPAMNWLVNSVIRFLPEALVNLDWIPRWILQREFNLSSDAHIELLLDMVRRHPGSDLRRLCRFAVSAPEPIEPDCPVFSIHGTKDKILNYLVDETDVPLHGAGHLISLTRPHEVNQAICNFVNRVECGLWRENERAGRYKPFGELVRPPWVQEPALEPLFAAS